MSDTKWTLETIASLDDISGPDWDKCALDGGQVSNPFVTYAFLSTLEKSGSAIVETGWLAQHLILRDEENQMRAALPAYLKNHSQGEYVFDHAWADAFERAGGSYYPKLQLSVPFTPVTGPRVLVNGDAGNKAIYQAFDQGVRQLCQNHNLSSAHMTFLPEDQWNMFGDLGWLTRTDIQFHWFNDGYESFDDFLATLSSRKRKNIRKERKFVADLGLEFEWLSGGDIHEHHLDAFFQFYQDTGARKWGTPYLTRQFFSMVTQSMPNNVLLIMARERGEYIAGALNFISSDTLYGRYWGAIEHYDNLHFETCYYQAMDFAIAKGLKTVEAGAQGPHKLARGYIPVTTHSAHYISNPDFNDAIKRFLSRERTYVARDNEILSGQTPFKKKD